MISRKFMIFRGTKFKRREDGLVKIVTKVPFSEDRRVRLTDAMDSILDGNRGYGKRVHNTFRVRLKTDDVKLRGYVSPWGYLHARAKGREPKINPLYNVLKEYMPR